MLVCAAALCVAAGCAAAGGDVAGGDAAGARPLGRVWVIVMENHGYGEIVGNRQAPWINRTLRTSGVATQYYAVAHPSQPNYIAMTSGSTHGVTSDDDVTVHAPNIASQLQARGKSWRAYMQSYAACSSPLASVCAGDLYARKHNPFASYGMTKNVVDLSRLSRDLAGGSAPTFSFIVPDQCHDMHGAGGCSDASLIPAGDRFLASTVGAITRSKAFTGNSAIIVTWDEADADNTHGGGHVLTFVIRPGGKPVRSSRTYDHYSLLRTLESGWGLGCLAKSCAAKPMSDLVG